MLLEVVFHPYLWNPNVISTFQRTVDVDDVGVAALFHSAPQLPRDTEAEKFRLG
jgi:hypothetical protein